MGLFAKWRIHRNVAEHETVDVSERDGVRYLHLGNDTVQSAMRVNAPNDLELAYTRAMMAFLLFHAEPGDVLMIGLGGGSLAKFVYHRLSGARTTVVEINPQVVAAARGHFLLPEPDARFQVEIRDGVEFMASSPEPVDVIMVDGFDSGAQVEALASQRFYDDCAAALRPGGMLVVNLWSSDRHFDIYLERIRTSFNHLVLCLSTTKHSNIVVLAFRRSPGSPRWLELRERAKQLEVLYGLEFLKFVDDLRALNMHSEKRLLV